MSAGREPGYVWSIKGESKVLTWPWKHGSNKGEVLQNCLSKTHIGADTIEKNMDFFLLFPTVDHEEKAEDDELKSFKV